ncbi:hypothetical protein GLW07_13825 [Bacillus hwajinpoensis]|uniref:Uncharacterized protein n=1 Tax=Guptibacillus hwajinpoensis TaxID=208199 RepID=A0A845F0V4_9BACL|nr:DUF6773 family protein [Pseudalkalibacillus hwajinpoensis]MYL64431.1 hypothetical protein [Pseudalkalibacillus hwajinpoensis]
MGFGFKRKQKDERVTNLQNKIYREMYILIVAICALSVLYKQFLVEGGTQHLWTEIIIFSVSSLYYLIRSTMLGIFSDEVEMHDRSSKMSFSKRNFLISLFFGVGFSLFLAIRNSLMYGEGTQETIYFFLTILFFCLVIYIPVLFGIMVLPYAKAKYKSDKINERELEEMDDEDVR